MNRYLNYCIAILVLTFVTKKINAQEKDMAYYVSHAPFKMEAMKAPVFPKAVFLITNYGAVNDGITLNTTAFAKAIEACVKAGGGVVNVPSGKWLTGPIELKSNVNLHLEKGALVQFTTDHTQYPIIHPGKGSNSYVVMSPLFGCDLENVAVTGQGSFDGAGDSWRPVKKSKVSESVWKNLIQSGIVSSDGKVWWPSADAMNGESYLKELKNKSNVVADDYLKAREFLRPYMFYLTNCKNVLVEGIELRNSPKFVFNPNRCTNLIINNINVYNDWWAQNGDGIDISACKNVVVYNSVVNAGDDGICMKSSGGKDTNDAQLQNVVIAKCTVLRGHGGFVIGSNTDGGMKNIYVTDCNFNGTDIGIRVKSNIGRGGNVRDIFIDNITMDNIINEAILITTFYDDKPVGKSTTESTVKVEKIPHFNNFHISNVTCLKAATAISVTGLAQQPTHDIYFDNLTITANKGFDATDAQNIFLNKVDLKVGKPKYTSTRSSNILIDGKPME